MTDPKYAPNPPSAPPAPEYAEDSATFLVVQRPPCNGQAIGAMVLGIIAAAVGTWAFIPFLGLISAALGFTPAMIAIVLGHRGTAAATRMGGTGRSQAMTGLILGYVTLSIIMLTTIFWLFVLTTTRN